jgi:hypothetical protein
MHDHRLSRGVLRKPGRVEQKNRQDLLRPPGRERFAANEDRVLELLRPHNRAGVRAAVDPGRVPVALPVLQGLRVTAVPAAVLVPRAHQAARAVAAAVRETAAVGVRDPDPAENAGDRLDGGILVDINLGDPL